MTTSDEIARLRGLLERATPDLSTVHRWHADGGAVYEADGDGIGAFVDVAAHGVTAEDRAEFVVAMRNALPALLDVADAALRQSGHNREESCCDLCRALAALGGGA